MRGTFAALQLFAAFFLVIFGLATAFRGDLGGALVIGAFLAALGFSFLALLALHLRK